MNEHGQKSPSHAEIIHRELQLEHSGIALPPYHLALWVHLKTVIICGVSDLLDRMAQILPHFNGSEMIQYSRKTSACYFAASFQRPMCQRCWCLHGLPMSQSSLAISEKIGTFRVFCPHTSPWQPHTGIVQV